jgi:hypothetical protein
MSYAGNPLGGREGPPYEIWVEQIGGAYRLILTWPDWYYDPKLMNFVRDSFPIDESTALTLITAGFRLIKRDLKVPWHQWSWPGKWQDESGDPNSQ